jgi:hypothetical protein
MELGENLDWKGTMPVLLSGNIDDFCDHARSVLGQEKFVSDMQEVLALQARETLI